MSTLHLQGAAGNLLLVNQPNFQIVERAISEFLAHMLEGVLELVLELFRIGPAIVGSSGRHIDIQEGFKISGNHVD